MGTARERSAGPLGPGRFTARRTPILATVVHVLELTNYEPVSLGEIHAACECALGTTVSYRALKSGLGEHQHSAKPKVIRTSRGYYRIAK